MGELGALFNPGMRHELEERQAKAARREEEGNAKDGDLRIDLESGVAVINVSGEDSSGESRTGDSQSPPSAGSDAADEPADAPPVAGKASSRSARPVKKSPRGAGSPEKPALQPRGKRGAPAAR